MFCEKCGKQLPDGARFCNGCGAKIEAEPVHGEAERAAARPAPVQPVNPNPAPPPFSPVPAAPAYAPPQSRTYPPPQPFVEPLRVGQYIGMFLLMMLPFVNVILLFVWSFGSAVNLNKRNFSRAALILCAISLILWIIAGGIFINVFRDIMNGYY